MRYSPANTQKASPPTSGRKRPEHRTAAGSTTVPDRHARGADGNPTRQSDPDAGDHVPFEHADHSATSDHDDHLEASVL
jgi:hypothetical protein